MVMSRFPFAPNAGQYFATGSSIARRRCSTNCSTAGVVATTLVSEARSKIVSGVMARGRRPVKRLPNARR